MNLHAGKETSQSWRLHLYGEFGLYNPVGERVELPNRKVEGLLAILALHRHYGIERSSVVRILWPRKEHEGLANLRQALSLLRKALGEDSISAPRGHCQLASEFALECDYDISSMRHSSSFMPGHEGEWFDDIRLGENGFDRESDESALPTSDFERTLQWLAHNSPSSMYGVMREAISLTQGIPAGNLLNLLTIAGTDPGSHHWREYWLAYMGEPGVGVEAANEQLHRTFRAAIQTEDNVLSVEVAYFWGASLMVQGRLAQAERVITAGHSCAMRSGNPQLIAKATSIRGVLLLHKGFASEGLADLERTEQSVGDTLSVAHAQALRAFFETSSGLHARALDTVKEPLRVARETGHQRLALMGSVAQSQALVGIGQATQSLDLILPVTDVLKDWKMSFFWPYAYESAAKAYLMSGEIGLAREQFVVAQRARALRGMPFTGPDRGRLSRADISQIASVR